MHKERLYFHVSTAAQEGQTLNICFFYFYLVLGCLKYTHLQTKKCAEGFLLSVIVKTTTQMEYQAFYAFCPQRPPYSLKLPNVARGVLTARFQ